MLSLLDGFILSNLPYEKITGWLRDSKGFCEIPEATVAPHVFDAVNEAGEIL